MSRPGVLNPRGTWENFLGRAKRMPGRIFQSLESALGMQMTNVTPPHLLDLEPSPTEPSVGCATP